MRFQIINSLKVIKIIISICLINMSIALNVFAVCGCPGDFDGDGVVDGSDLAVFTNYFGSTACQSLKNIRCVGYDETIQSVIDSITDASADMPYTIFILPGVYDCTDQGIEMEEYVHLRGSGVEATKIITADSYSIKAISNSSISDMTIKYSGSGHAAIKKGGQVRDFVLNRVVFNIFGDNSAIYFSSGADFLIWMYNVTIVTEGKGIHTDAGGHYYLHDVDIFLTGDNIGAPHIGIQVDRHARFYIWGSKIGTGYGYPSITNDTDQDVIGLYVPSYNTHNPRIEIHGLESFCRNENAQEGVNVNVIRAEAGWVRCFGCFGQAEIPPRFSDQRTLHQSGDGILETIGCRFSNFEGNIFGSPQRGVSQYTTADHNLYLGKFRGGLILLDATNGPFTIKLREILHQGTEYIFKKIDSTGNAVTVSGNGNTIDGQNSVFLTSQYETLRIIAGYDEWYTY